MFTTRTTIARLTVLALVVAAAGVLTATASGKSGVRQDYVTEQAALTGAGVTPTDLARAVPRESNSPGGVTPTDLARSVSREDVATSQVSRSTKSEAVWGSADRNHALGFGLGIALALIAGLALTMSRNRIRIAHS